MSCSLMFSLSYIIYKLIQEYFSYVYDDLSFLIEAGKLVTSNYTTGMQMIKQHIICIFKFVVNKSSSH